MYNVEWINGLEGIWIVFSLGSHGRDVEAIVIWWRKLYNFDDGMKLQFKRSIRI